MIGGIKFLYMLEHPKVTLPDTWKNGVNATMDNQQVKELAYLAGIIDGEGCITLSLQQYRKGRYRLLPSIQIANTSQVLVDYLSNLLYKYGIAHHICWHKGKGKAGKPWASVVVQRFSMLKNLAVLMQPFLIIKKRQAEILADFLSGRLLSDGRAKKNGIIDPYTERDFLLLFEIKSLNGHPPTQEPQRLYEEYLKRRDNDTV